MSDYISREAVKQIIAAQCGECADACLEFDGIQPDCNQCLLYGAKKAIESIPAADVRPVPAGGIGEMSDGYHTFNGLYYQRMVLFAALVRQNRGRAWKSWKHEGGELCFGGGWFIVGIDTPQGTYTYHYEAKDFDLFDCEELPVAKHWDGHTEKDVTRLLSLDVRPVVRGRWIQTTQPMGWRDEECAKCSVCGDDFVLDEWAMDEFTNLMNYCPNCGADMKQEAAKEGERA